jgi:hypothetical protein
VGFKREDDYRDDKFYHDRASFYYKQFRQKQKELNISDDDLKKLFVFKEEWLPEWDKKTAE